MPTFLNAMRQQWRRYGRRRPFENRITRLFPATTNFRSQRGTQSNCPCLCLSGWISPLPPSCAHCAHEEIIWVLWTLLDLFVLSVSESQREHVTQNSHFPMMPKKYSYTETFWRAYSNTRYTRLLHCIRKWMLGSCSIAPSIHDCIP
jgi:hypothetical protein